MSVRYLWLGLIFGFMVMGESPVLAEMYKYRDQQGNICFTDNLAQIPVDQRPQAESLEAIETHAAMVKEVEDTDTAATATEDIPEDRSAADSVVDQATIDALNQRKQELDNEFSSLMAEKYTLLQEKERLAGLAGRDVKARQAYESKVTDLNNRIADYKTRRDAFQKECAQVKQVLEPSSPEEDAETPSE